MCRRARQRKNKLSVARCPALDDHFFFNTATTVRKRYARVTVVNPLPPPPPPPQPPSRQTTKIGKTQVYIYLPDTNTHRRYMYVYNNKTDNKKKKKLGKLSVVMLRCVFGIASTNLIIRVCVTGMYRYLDTRTFFFHRIFLYACVRNPNILMRINNDEKKKKIKILSIYMTYTFRYVYLGRYVCT